MSASEARKGHLGKGGPNSQSVCDSGLCDGGEFVSQATIIDRRALKLTQWLRLGQDVGDHGKRKTIKLNTGGDGLELRRAGQDEVDEARAERKARREGKFSADKVKPKTKATAAKPAPAAAGPALSNKEAHARFPKGTLVSHPKYGRGEVECVLIDIVPPWTPTGLRVGFDFSGDQQVPIDSVTIVAKQGEAAPGQPAKPASVALHRAPAI